jgi:hypothetical protein
MLSRGEIVGILLVVAVVLCLIGWLIRGQLQMLVRRADRAEPFEWELRASALPDPGAGYVAGGRGIHVRNQQSEMPPLERPVTAKPSPRGAGWPSRPSYGVSRPAREPVRSAVRHMLEGGPDYRG